MAKSNTLSLILAKKGSGKTILGTCLAYAQNKPLFIITPNVGGIATFKHDLINSNDVDLELMISTRASMIFYAQQDEFDDILSDLIEIDNTCILIDELDFYLGKSTNNKTAFFKLINYGRHREIDLIAIARRAQDIPKTLTSQMDFLYVGKQGLDINDSRYIVSFLGCEELAERASLSFGVGDFYKIDLVNNKIDFIRIPKKIADSISKKEYLNERHY